MTQEIDSSNITNKFYTKTDGDENPSTIYNQKNTNTKSISSSDAPGDKRSIDQERNLKKKRTLDQAENTKQNGGYPHNYPGDVSGSEHSVIMNYCSYFLGSSSF